MMPALNLDHKEAEWINNAKHKYARDPLQTYTLCTNSATVNLYGISLIYST